MPEADEPFDDVAVGDEVDLHDPVGAVRDTRRREHGLDGPGHLVERSVDVGAVAEVDLDGLGDGEVHRRVVQHHDLGAE